MIRFLYMVLLDININRIINIDIHRYVHINIDNIDNIDYIDYIDYIYIYRRGELENVSGLKLNSHQIMEKMRKTSRFRERTTHSWYNPRRTRQTKGHR